MYLTVTLLQNNLVWEDIDANLLAFEEQMAGLPEGSDLIILPEMFTTGFSNNAEKLAVTMDSYPVRWMLDHAARQNAMMMGSMIIQEDGKYFNRLISAFPDGNLLTYDKRHLFSLMKENEYYTAGDSHLIFEFRGWKLFPLICYDLRFPVWCRNTDMADLMIFVANWPEKRHFHWTTLLKARAIENQCYVAGVNRIGPDNNGIPHNGESGLYDFWGKELVSARNLQTAVTATLSKTVLSEHRERFAFWKDRDTFEIQK
jgi:predicted amidohydrolase